MSTPTPTPRTDAAWASSFEPCEYRAAHTARTMRDECVKLERELAAEREKVRVLQEAMKFSANKDKYFQAQFYPCQRASAAMAATEGTK